MWPLDLLHDSAWRPLSWTLLHFLWQGLIVAAVLAIVQKIGGRKKARERMGSAVATQTPAGSNASREADTSRICSASTVARRLAVRKARVFEAIRTGVLRADFQDDAGRLYFRAARLRSIRRKLLKT